MLKGQSHASLLQMSEAPFDIEKIDRSLERSERRRQVWGWVAAKAIGEPFYGIDIWMDLKIVQGTVHYQLKSLEELELIARNKALQTSVNTSHPPLEKVDNPLWVPVNILLVKHGIELPPETTQ
jgi:hypothetical protein